MCEIHCRKCAFSVKFTHHQELGLAAHTNLPNRARWFADVALRGNQADALMRAFEPVADLQTNVSGLLTPSFP